MGYAEELAQYDEEYEQTEGSGRTALFTDGKHQAVIATARVEWNENRNTWQWFLNFRGIDSRTRKPARAGKWTNLPPEEGRGIYLRDDLDMLDYHGKPSELQAACESGYFIGLVVDIGVVTKTGDERDFTNVYINRLYEKVDPDEWLASRGAAMTSSDHAADGPYEQAPGYDTDDDIPF